MDADGWTIFPEEFAKKNAGIIFRHLLVIYFNNDA